MEDIDSVTAEVADGGPAGEPSAAATAMGAPVVRGALLRNVATVVFLIGLPLIGIVAVWTLSTWNRKAKIILTALFALPAVYYPFIVFSALVKAAF